MGDVLVVKAKLASALTFDAHWLLDGVRTNIMFLCVLSQKGHKCTFCPIVVLDAHILPQIPYMFSRIPYILPHFAALSHERLLWEIAALL